MKMLIEAFVLIVLVLVSPPARAGINQDMNNFFNSIGVGATSTPAGIYQSQAGGYITGGGLSARVPNRNFQLLSITLPSITAGCGGINMFLGGFSFINTAQFTSMLRNIGNNAVGYAFQLALQTFAPQIYSTMDSLEKKIQKYTQMATNSCHAAQTAVNGLAGVLTENSAKGCEGIAEIKGFASDRADSTKKCQNPAFRAQMYNPASMTPAEKAASPIHKNLLWAGMEQQTYTGVGIPMKEFLMSLIGTYTVDSPKTGPPLPIWHPPTHLTINMLIYGSPAAPVYKCTDNTTSCLKPVVQNIKIIGYQTQVRQALDELRLGLEAERGGVLYITPVPPAALKLIQISQYPVMKMLSTAVGISSQFGIEIENALVKPVAFDLVAVYLDWAYKAAADAAAAAEKTIPQDLSKAYMAHVEFKHKEFIMVKNNAKVISTMEIIKKAEFLDKVLVGNMTPHFQQVFQYAQGQ